MKEQKVVFMSDLELAHRLGLWNLLQVSNGLSNVDMSIPYKGPTFMVALAKLTIHRDNGKEPKIIMGEGVSRKSFSDTIYREVTGSNLARERALEALDKKLRRSRPCVGHRFEG